MTADKNRLRHEIRFLWGIDALIAAVVGGSLGLRSTGRIGPGTIVLLILAVPGLLFALFFIALLVTKSRWN